MASASSASAQRIASALPDMLFLGITSTWRPVGRLPFPMRHRQGRWEGGGMGSQAIFKAAESLSAAGFKILRTGVCCAYCLYFELATSDLGVQAAVKATVLMGVRWHAHTMRRGPSKKTRGACAGTRIFTRKLSWLLAC